MDEEARICHDIGSATDAGNSVNKRLNCGFVLKGMYRLGIYCVTVVPLTFVNAPASVDVLIETVLVALPYILVASLLEHSMKGAAAIRDEIAASC